ncbi:MAG: type II toxin-antitoxin system RelE/ParE family toxin [Candidatus Diapherotrites archaeon]|nr:type II toxin-antitoxin system RelE/ParE family toxin [Candidatus Diapherotrites archaeon]
MTFAVKLSPVLVEQLNSLDEKEKKTIWEKIKLIEENPFHFKKIHSQRFRKVFRVRLSIQGKETRLIYVVLEPNIIIACLLERKRDYKDLEKYLKKL